MQLSLQTFTTLVQNMAAAVQSSASQLLDLTVGSALRAVIEANASLALWLQWLILLVLQTTRAATSNGPDLDTWMADFSLSRLPAQAATGAVTLSRYTPTMTALVPIGALVRTADGTQTFAITADPTNPSYSTAQNGYVLAAGVASLDVPVVAQVAGTAGNVQGNSISLFVTAIPGLDTVANPAAFRNGLDAETDDGFRARFQNFIVSRSRATLVAIEYAIANVRQGLAYTIQENVDSSGRTVVGNFVVTVDDGSGSPSSDLLEQVNSAVDAVRPVGCTFYVQPPSIISANVSLNLTVSAGAIRSQVDAVVATAITTFINGLQVGVALPLTKIAQVAYSAHSAVINVTNIQVNGTGADIAPGQSAVVKAAVVAVN